SDERARLLPSALPGSKQRQANHTRFRGSELGAADELSPIQLTAANGRCRTAIRPQLQPNAVHAWGQKTTHGVEHDLNTSEQSFAARQSDERTSSAIFRLLLAVLEDTGKL